MTFPTPGSYPVADTSDLPHVSVAFPGEHWSNRKASGAITPGAAVVARPPVGSEKTGRLRQALAGDSASLQWAIALRTVQVPDQNVGPSSSGPNEIMNTEIANGEWVHAYYSGAFHLTLFDPADTYLPGDLLGWDADGARPSGISGAGSWRLSGGNTDLDNLLEVIEFRNLGLSTGAGILTVRTLRGQF